jgi:subtilisin family serine protease
MKLHTSRSRWSWAVVACVMLVSLQSVGNAASAAYSPNSLSYVPNEYIIQAVAGSSLQSVSTSLSQLGGVLVKALPLPDTYLVRMGQSSGIGARRVMAGGVAYAPWVIKSFCPNAVYKVHAVPNDEHWADLWGMRSINMPQAWNIQKGSASVTVAVIDTGTGNHPDLVGRLVPGWDFIDNDADPSNDMIGHGTHTAGTIGAQGDNSIGVCGVCWDGVKIMPIRVFGTAGSTTDIVIQGEDYALQQKADVVNMSYGGPPGYSDPIEHAKIQEMAAAGMILCASAGNDGFNTPPWVASPALFPECIAVAAIGPNDEIAPYSSSGPGNEVDIAAPGGDSFLGMNAEILSTIVTWNGTTPVYDYEWMEGTSMACPHVAGAAALLLSAGIPAADVRSRLESSARKVPGMDKKKFGNGILDVNAALSNGSITIIKPTKGGTVNSYPDFRLNIRGIDPTSVRVYLDYADANGDGIPDNTANEIPVLAGVAASGYLNGTRSAISFNWAQISPNVPLATGLHFIYVIANTSVGGDPVFDWGTFTVASKTITAGQHLFAFPYGLTTTNPDGTVTVNALPSDLLIDAATSQPVDFRVQISDRARLIRWSAPQSAYYSYITGLANSAQNTPLFDDRCWLNPVARMLLPDGTIQAVPTAGGFLGQDPTQSLQFPAGAGFWLILQKDAVISSGYTEINAPQGFGIYLYKGWNIIGNPYTHDVPLTAVRLTYQGVTRTLDQDQLQPRPWVDGTFYGYKSGSGYEIVPPDQRLLEPYAGYWLRALVGGISPRESLVMTVQ